MVSSDQQKWQRVYNNDKTDSYDEIEDKNKFKERELKEPSSHFPNVVHNIDGPNISVCEIVNIAPGKCKMLVFFTSEHNWEGLALPKDYSTGTNLFTEDRTILITPSNRRILD